MATIVPVTTFPIETSLDVAVTTWGNLAADDDGEPVRLAVYSDRAIQVAGTFGGASVTIGGSNDGGGGPAAPTIDGPPRAAAAAARQQVSQLPRTQVVLNKKKNLKIKLKITYYKNNMLIKRWLYRN